MKVSLNGPEMRQAVQEGGLRRIRRIVKTARADVFPPKDRWGTDIEAAAAEIAFAKAMGLYWAPSTGAQGRTQCDVGDYEVRYTQRPDGPLTVYVGTDDSKLCVLVRGECPDFEIVGCLYAHEAKQPEFWQVFANSRDGGAYRVPQTVLRSLPRPLVLA